MVRAVRRASLIALLIVLAVAALLGIEIALAVSRKYDQTSPPLVVGGEFGPQTGTPLSFAVLGDSTAAGVGAGDAAHAYPALLAERLGGLGWRVELTDLGISGARVHDVLVDQLPQVERLRPGLIFVGIGANDATHGTSLGSVARDMRQIVTRLRATGAVVVVAGAPDMRAAAFLPPLRWLVGWRGRRVAAAIEAAARDQGVAVVPLAERTGGFFVRDPDRYFSADRFHPGPEGYRTWADAIEPVLEQALSQSGKAPAGPA